MIHDNYLTRISEDDNRIPLLNIDETKIYEFYHASKCRVGILKTTHKEVLLAVYVLECKKPRSSQLHASTFH